jgi:hypothetical protein
MKAGGSSPSPPIPAVIVGQSNKRRTHMMEMLRHLIGFCGEHWHPSLMNVIASGFGFIPAVAYVKSRFGK